MEPWGGMTARGGGGLETRSCERAWLDVCTLVEQLWIFLYARQTHTIISFNAVCAPSGEIKANEMWQMNADMKTKSWAPSGPNALNTPIYITSCSHVKMMSCCSSCFIVWATLFGADMQVCECAFVLTAQIILLSIKQKNPHCSPRETLGSNVAQANGQLMGLHTAPLVPKCLQIKQFIIPGVHTYTYRDTFAKTHASTHTLCGHLETGQRLITGCT